MYPTNIILGHEKMFAFMISLDISSFPRFITYVSTYYM